MTQEGSVSTGIDQLIMLLYLGRPEAFFAQAWPRTEPLPRRKDRLLVGTSEMPVVMIRSEPSKPHAQLVVWTISWWRDAGDMGGFWEARSYRDRTLTEPDKFGYQEIGEICDPKLWFQDVIAALKRAA